LRDWYAGNEVADALDKLGWQPTTDDEKVHYLVAKMKVDEYVKKEYFLLRGRKGKGIEVGKEGHFSLSKKKVDELKQIWNITKRVLLKDIESNSNDYRVIENAVHALLSIEKREIIQELINILNRKGTKEMAEVYLNCGCPELFKTAKSWAFWHGYEIYVSEFAFTFGIGEEGVIPHLEPKRYKLRTKK
jgi:hypothetical protein